MSDQTQEQLGQIREGVTIQDTTDQTTSQQPVANQNIQIPQNNETTVILPEDSPKTLREKLGIQTFVVSGLKIRKILSILNQYSFLIEKQQKISSQGEEEYVSLKVKTIMPTTLLKLENQIEIQKSQSADYSDSLAVKVTIERLIENNDYQGIANLIGLTGDDIGSVHNEIIKAQLELDICYEQLILTTLHLLGSTARADILTASELDELISEVINEKQNNIPDYFIKMLTV